MTRPLRGVIMAGHRPRGACGSRITTVLRGKEARWGSPGRAAASPGEEEGRERGEGGRGGVGSGRGGGATAVEAGGGRADPVLAGAALTGGSIGLSRVG